MRANVGTWAVAAIFALMFFGFSATAAEVLLTVNSNPSGVAIEGSIPGITDYSVMLEEGSLVWLTAPEQFTSEGKTYNFVKWTLNCVSQPQGQMDIPFFMEGEQIAEAIYSVQMWDLNVTVSPAAIAGHIPITADPAQYGGTCNYTKQVEDSTLVSLSAPATFMVNNTIYEFVRWTVNGVNQQSGIISVSIPMLSTETAQAKYLTISPTLAITSTPITGVPINARIGYTAPGLNVSGTTNYGIYFFEGDRLVMTAPAQVTSGGVVYTFDRWWRGTFSYPQGERGVSYNLPFDDIVFRANYTAPPVELTINSTPVEGVAITGTVSVTTNATVIVEDGSAQSLTAPASFDFSGNHYDFIRWTGGSDGELGITFTMAGARTVTAEYAILHSLNVNSEPTGAAIAGTHPGTANYSESICDGTQVALTAPDQFTSSGKRYNFVKWTLDGVDQPDGQKDIAFVMDADKIATVVYAVQMWTLNVEAYPFDEVGAIAIIGDPAVVGGTCNYSREVEDGAIITLSAPWHFTSGYYDCEFIRWTVNGIYQLAGERVLTVPMVQALTARAKYMCLDNRNVLIESSPVPGVLINARTGMAPPYTDVSGTTNYGLFVFEGERLVMTAPAQAVIGGVTYTFVRWWRGTFSYPEGQRGIMYNMPASDVTFRADYQAGYPIAIGSEPIQSIPIQGDLPGSTNYSAIASEAVTLTAPATWDIGCTVAYNFIRWTINGAPQADGQTAVSVVMDGPKDVVAQYFALAKGDCDRSMDNPVDFADLMPFIFSYQRAPPDPLYNSLADFDSDGDVDFDDLMAMVRGYQKAVY